jgi:hypothetical protein
LYPGSKNLVFHGILTPLSMALWHPYPWYIEFSTHGILTAPTHCILTPLFMVYRSPFPWYIDHPIHGISTHTHGISNPLPM